MTPTRKEPLSLYLVRHGQTEWSLSGQHTGSTNIPLTARGEEEVRGLIPWLRPIKFSLVLTSPLQRARRTCELIGLGREAEIEPDLAEWDYGDYEGVSTAEVRRTTPDWSVWTHPVTGGESVEQVGEFQDGCPDGEMPAQVSDRADRLIERLAATKGNVALFSHGQFGPALAARWIGLSVAEGRHLPLGTASLGILSFHPAHPEVRVLALWNVTPARFTS